MMWATGMMAAMMPARMPAKGMVGMLIGMGGGLLAEDAAAVVAAAMAAAAAAAVMGAAAVAAAYCRACLLFNVKIFLCGILFGRNWQGHTSPHTLVTFEVCRRTFGWGWLLSSKIVV
jgi:hypothetical protein